MSLRSSSGTSRQSLWSILALALAAMMLLVSKSAATLLPW
jgi:hypothetical protein